MWQRLARAVSEILNHNSGSLSYEENYRYAYMFVLVSQRYGLAGWLASG